MTDATPTAEEHAIAVAIVEAWFESDDSKFATTHARAANPLTKRIAQALAAHAAQAVAEERNRPWSTSDEQACPCCGHTPHIALRAGQPGQEQTTNQGESDG